MSSTIKRLLETVSSHFVTVHTRQFILRPLLPQAVITNVTGDEDTFSYLQCRPTFQFAPPPHIRVFFFYFIFFLKKG